MVKKVLKLIEEELDGKPDAIMLFVKKGKKGFAYVKSVDPEDLKKIIEYYLKHDTAVGHKELEVIADVINSQRIDSMLEDVMADVKKQEIDKRKADDKAKKAAIAAAKRKKKT